MTTGPEHTSQRGATVIEVALVAPALFLVLIALFEMGLVVIGNSEASNAAREGARVAILQFEDADVPGSPNRIAIEDRVRSRLPGTVDVDTVVIDVECVVPDTFAVLPCTYDDVVLGVDLVQVTVRWDHLLDTPFVPTPPVGGDDREVARMVIVGEPDLSPPGTVPAPPSCRLTDVETSRQQTRLDGTELRQPVEVSWVASRCEEVRVEVDVNDSETFVFFPATSPVVLQSSPTPTLQWTAGIKDVVVSSGAESVTVQFEIRP